MTLDPNWMHRVPDCSPQSLAALVDLLSRSSQPEHWLYREAELDDLWRHAEMELQTARSMYPDSSLVSAYENLHAVAFTAHNLAAAGRLDEAASELRTADERLQRARALHVRPT